jgi:PAS domain S-box-containing protein
MGKPLRVLIVEDSENDALLVIRELKRGGYDVTFKRVETAEAMTAALDKQAWDVIISDYHLPHFSAPEALELLHQSSLDLPFIVVSGTIGEETAAQTMKAGAHDYVMKDNLKRLTPAIERELYEAKIRKEHKQAEEALRESEEKLRTILDNTYDVIFQLSPLGTIQYVSPKVEEIYGYKPEDLLGKHLKKTTPVSELPTALKALKSILLGEIINNLEINQMDANGNIISMEISGAPVRKGGKIVAMQGIMRDITERKRVEKELRESEGKFRSLYSTMTEGVCLHDIIYDKSGKAADYRIIDINPAYESILGLKRDDVVGSKVSELYGTGQPPYLEIYAEVVASEKPIHFETYFPPMKKHFAISVFSPGKGKFATVFSDITERKQTEEKIEKAAEEWRTTFDSITDFVSICDKDFRLIRVNKAFADVVKMKPKKLIGKPCYEIVHGTKEPLPNCPHKKTIETKKPATAEFFEPNLGIHLEVMTSPIFNEKGEVTASVHVIRDITERKKMEEQLMVTDRLASIGELASGVAHELNNPLTSVIGFSDLLLARDLPDDIKEDLKVINREAQRTAGIVKNLLTFARKHKAEKKLVNINELIQKVLELRAYEQKVNNIQTNTQFSPDLPKTKVDSFQLQQVFINIIINAEHFMDEAHRRGTLTITTERAGDIIRASFADDGPGILKENLRHLFDPFFTTKEVGRGTGLGLSICHGIITEHGGRIYAESELGKGATFVVELPVTNPDKGGTNK